MNLSGRYSQHARRAVMLARLYARSQQHPDVDTSHLLVGILQAEGSLGYRVLSGLGLTRAAAEAHTADLHDPAPPDTPDPLPITDALRNTIALAVEESTLLGHHYIGTEHLLLGVARGGEGAAQDVLYAASISLDQLRRQVRRAVQEGTTEIGLESALRLARLSELSRRVISRATLIADDLGHPDPALPHLALALAQEKRSPAGRALRACGLDEDRLRGVLAGADPVAEALEIVLDEAVLYAEHLGSHYTGTDHITLTLAHNRQGARLLASCGVDLKQLTRRINALLTRR